MKNLLKLSIFAGLVLVNSISNCAELSRTEQAMQAINWAKNWVTSGVHNLRAKLPTISMPTMPKLTIPEMPSLPSMPKVTLPSIPSIDVGSKLSSVKAGAGNFIDSSKNALIAIEWQKYVEALKSRLSQAEWQKIAPNLGTIFIIFAICKHQFIDTKNVIEYLNKKKLLTITRLNGQKTFKFNIDDAAIAKSLIHKENVRTALIGSAGIALHVLTYMQQNGYLKRLADWFKSDAFKYSEMSSVAQGIISGALGA